MDPVNQRREGRGGELGLYLVAGVVGAYVVMLGPAVRWHDRLPPALQRGVEIVYTPVEWVHDNTPLRIPLGFYIDLWR